MSAPAAPPPAQFQKIGTYQNLGGVPNSMVGPGPTPGSQRLYLNYMYVDNTLDVVAVDPDTGAAQVYHNPAPSEYGDWGLVAGDDGCMYVGTLPHAHMLKLDPRTGKMIDLGRPADTEQYIWNLAVGTDHKIYGCTYPGAKLVRYDPATNKTEDLGRLDPTELYARYIAASSDGYVYIGIGTSKMNIAAYNIATGVHTEILPEDARGVGIANVYKAVDGEVYGVAGDFHYHLVAGAAEPMPKGEELPKAINKRELADGRTINADIDGVVVTDPKTKQTKHFDYSYKGQALTVFRLGAGQDGQLYGSGILPSYFFHLDPATHDINTYGLVGGGESYSIVQRGDKILLGNYSGKSPLMIFDPKKPFHVGKHKGDNPLEVNYEGQEGSWRPQAMIDAPDGKVYIGAVSAYGKLGGPLTIWDPETNHVQEFNNIIPDESVVSLAWDNGLIYGGTTIDGGGGAHTTKTTATFFIFDPKTQKIVFSTNPVPDARGVNDLIAANGKVYGFAGKNFFVFDIASRKIIKSIASQFSGTPYNSVVLGPDGLIWGLATEGIFTIDPTTDALALVAKAPEPITGGFGVLGHDIYYASDSAIYKCTMPQEGLGK